jgi:predicted phage-related endonuclease
MIRYRPALVQGSDEWLAARCGLLTASEMKHIITPAKLQYASNDKERSHLYELLAQRITKHVEPHYVSDDMLRGQEDEIDAKAAYAKHYAPVQAMGFVTNDKWGFTLGYSPDALVGDDGQIECKGRRQKYQFETIIANQMPAEFLIQVQTGLLVTERKWCDFVSYCGGVHMLTLRVHPDRVVQDAIVEAATTFHQKLEKLMEMYTDRLLDGSSRLIPTERRIVQEITV